MWEYTDTVREHFLHPRNVGVIEDADAVGEVGSLACGDALKLYLKIDGEVITDARFQTFGCASAIASSSVLTELLKGKTVDQARAITNKDIAQALGGLPKEKMHCSVMGQEALEAALRNWAGEPAGARHEHREGVLVCKCFGVYDDTIRKAIADNGLKTAEDVTSFTKAGGGCGDCVPAIEALIAEVRGLPAPQAAPTARKLTNIQRMQLVTRTIDEEIRPSLKKDGGDIELLDICGTTVQVALRGSCVGCPSSGLTLKNFVEKRLREAVDPDIDVQQVLA